jgi:hypothetical protein
MSQLAMEQWIPNLSLTYNDHGPQGQGTWCNHGVSGRQECSDANVFPIILGPHGSQLSDVIRALASLSTLDKGIYTIINGEETNFCVCTVRLTGS